jgi:acyl-CoA thioesterase-1
MLARFQRDVLDKKPDVVTISVGINDVWHGFTAAHPAGYGPNRVPLPEYRKNVAAMLEAAKKAGVKVVLFTTTIFEDKPDSPRNLRLAGYNDVLRELAREYGAVLADQNAAFMAAWKQPVSGGAKLTTDEVHLAPRGDSLMARTALLAMGVSAKDLDRVELQVAMRVPK